ncbi:MAG: GGDEF domain-containing protein [Gemmatimonadota bacterium]|nr:GGDEF domain-containing protein [Gemmatimonadota bacterium]
MTEGYQHSRRRSRAITGSAPQAPPPELPAWRRLLLPPDPLQMDAGAEGELLVARVRTVLILLLLPIPFINMALDPGNRTAALIGLGAGLAALSLALGAQLLLRRDFYRPWVGLATSLLDVTCVSAGLGAFLVVDQAIATVNSRLLFEVYFIAIGATALRYDARVSLAAGAMAMLQYLVVVLLAYHQFDVANPLRDHRGYGAFDWATQVSRLLLLGVTALLAAGIVLRSQRLRQQSRSDRLTGLPNRSFFDDRVAAELSRARRYGTPVALLMIDVDHFKRFNDTHGHAAGDVALKAVATALQEATRQSDIVVRYGGEEFVALLPDLYPVAATERAEMLRHLIEEMPIGLPRRSEVARITISIGVAAYGYDGTQAEDLLDRADARLFQAKEGGRNRVVGPPPESEAFVLERRASGGHSSSQQSIAGQ